MRDFSPRRPTGFDDEALFAQSVHSKIHGPSGDLCDSSTVHWQRTSRGIFAHAKASKGGNASTFRGKLKSLDDDFVTCHSWDGTTEGSTDVLVLKSPKLFVSLVSANVMDEGHSYSYEDNLDGDEINNITRTDTLTSGPRSGKTEDQRVEPPWVKDDEIFAISIDPVTVTKADDTTVTVSWLMIAPWRQWAEI